MAHRCSHLKKMTCDVQNVGNAWLKQLSKLMPLGGFVLRACDSAKTPGASFDKYEKLITGMCPVLDRMPLWQSSFDQVLRENVFFVRVDSCFESSVTGSATFCVGVPHKVIQCAIYRVYCVCGSLVIAALVDVGVHLAVWDLMHKILKMRVPMCGFELRNLRRPDRHRHEVA